MQVFHTGYPTQKTYAKGFKGFSDVGQEKIVFSADGTVGSQPADLS